MRFRFPNNRTGPRNIAVCIGGFNRCETFDEAIAFIESRLYDPLSFWRNVSGFTIQTRRSHAPLELAQVVEPWDNPGPASGVDQPPFSTVTYWREAFIESPDVFILRHYNPVAGEVNET